MGFQDRDYYRSNSRGSAFLSGTAPVCRAIILLNVLVFVLIFITKSDRLFGLLVLDGPTIFPGLQLWRLVTAPFVHAPGQGFLLFGNMLFLWFVGREMETFLGTREFAWLYGSAAVLGGLVFTACDHLAGGEVGAYFGSSASVLATVVLCALYHPSKEVWVFFFPLELRWLMTIYLGFLLLQAFGGPAQSLASVAPQLATAAYAALFKTADLRLGSLKGMIRRPRPRLRVISADDPFREARPTRPAPPPPPRDPGLFTQGSTWINDPPAASASRPSPTIVSEEQLNARVDEILIKIAQEGKDRLTDEENRILDEASKRARSRRSERI